MSKSAQLASLLVLICGAFVGRSYANDVAFTVHGSLIEDALFGTPRRIDHSFECVVSNGYWSIKIDADRQVVLVTTRKGKTTQLFFPKHQRAGCDFDQFYQVSQTEPKEKRFNSNGLMGPGRVPFGVSDAMLAVWYTFASGSYLSGRNGGKILPLHPVMADDVKSNTYLCDARWELIANSPGLPQRLQTSNSFGMTASMKAFKDRPFAHTNTMFEVLGMTNLGNFILPKSVAVNHFFYFDAEPQIKRFHSKRISLEVTQVGPVQTNVQFVPAIVGDAFIVNLHYLFRNPPVSISTHSGTGWPSSAVFEKKYSTTVRRKSRH